jgi:hypothetical protein
MARKHPRSRKERIALHKRLGKHLARAKDGVAGRVNKRGTQAKKNKAEKREQWESTTD